MQLLLFLEKTPSCWIRLLTDQHLMKCLRFRLRTYRNDSISDLAVAVFRMTPYFLKAAAGFPCPKDTMGVFFSSIDTQS